MFTLKDLPQRGQGLVEYAMILVMVAIVVLVILTVLGPVVGNMYSGSTSQLNAL